MATQVNHVMPVSGVASVNWTLVSGETGVAHAPNNQQSLAMFVAVSAVTASAVVTVELSADGSNWFTAKDMFGNAVETSAGSAGSFEMSTGALYIRARVAGGDATVTIISRG